MDKFMRQAFEQAKRGYGEGNLPVGSVVVDSNDEVIGVGRNRQHQTRDPTSHAELEAIRDASRRTDNPDIVAIFGGATCYTTMMPCAMCAGALIRFGFSRVVVAETQSYTPSGSEALMERQGIAIDVHQLTECIELVETYNAEHAELVEAMRRRGRAVLKI